MKKIFLLPVVFLMLMCFSACTEDSLDPRPVEVGGQYVRLDITKKRLAYEHQDVAVFGGQLTAPANNVQRYELFVRRTNSFGITSGNYVKILTVESFPYELSVTPQMIADALGIPVTELQLNDTYRFLGYSYGPNGEVADYNKLSSTVKAQPGMKQGYKFMTDFVIDSDLTEAKLSAFDNYQL